MSEQISITSLPADLLLKIFDYLDVRCQCAVRQTCEKLNRIVSRERYISKMRMVLNAFNLNPNNKMLMTRIKRYRSFTLRDSLDDEKYLQQVRAFLHSEEIATRVEELKLDMLQYSLLDVFSGSEKVRMPNLKKLIVLPRVTKAPEHLVDFCLEAPNLKYVEFRDSASALVPITRIMRGKFETIVLKQMDMAEAIPLISQHRFDYLQTLTMIMTGTTANWRREQKFTGDDGLLLGLLRHLTLISDGNYFTHAMAELFKHTHLLKSLHVEGSLIPKEALRELLHLPTVEELCLISPIDGLPDIARLSYPQLRRLTVSQQLLPLGSVPNLKWIRVVNNGARDDLYPLHYYAVEDFFEMVQGTLETLIFDGININSTTADQISQLTKLRTLRIIDAKLTSYWRKRLQVIFGHRVRFINCTNVEEMLQEPSSTSSNSETNQPNFDESILDDLPVREMAGVALG